MKTHFIPALVALVATASWATGAATVVDLNGAFTTVQGSGALAVEGGLPHSFGTLSSFGLPALNSFVPAGPDRQVLSFGAAANGNAQGLRFTHATTSPNVNGYSLLMDVYFPPELPNYVALLQLDNGNPSTDADLFARAAGVGISGDYEGGFAAGEWQRVVLTVDPTHTNLNVYIEGVWTNSITVSDADRYNLDDASFLLFADEDGEVAAGYLATFAFDDRVYSAEEVRALGAATPVVPEPGSLLLMGLGAATVLRRRRS